LKYWSGLLFILLVMPVDPAMAATGDNVASQSGTPFTVKSRKHRFDFVPCDDCHEGAEVNPDVLEMMTDLHAMEIRHGNADLLCTNCHMLEKGGSLHTLSGKKVDMDESYRVCAQCHSGEFRDWQFGAHGKRMKRWRGGREVLNCTGCHDPHNETGIQPRAPAGPPGVRKHLQRGKGGGHKRKHNRWGQAE